MSPSAFKLPVQGQLRTVTAARYKPSEKAARWNVHWTDRLFAKYYERTICCWYCKSVTFTTLVICTRTLAGNLSLWRVTANVSSEGESGFFEAGMKHKSFYNFL